MINKKGFLFSFLTLLSFYLICNCLVCPSVRAASDPRVSIEAENADLVSVLKTIAEQADANLVVSKSVSGTVTLKLKDVPLTQALDSVLKSNNYLYNLQDGIINVYSYSEVQQEQRFSEITTRVYTLKNADVSDLRRPLLSMKSVRGRIELNEKANQVIVTDTKEKISEIENAIAHMDQPQITKKYTLLFADAADVKTRLEEVITADKGTIFVDERTNSVIVKATPVIMNNIAGLIEGWDVQSKQVLIEAKILQVTLDNTDKTGFDWQFNPGKYDMNLSFAQGLTTGGVFQVGKIPRNNYESVLEMLKSSTNTNVLSAPRVVVLNGKEASILVGSSEPYLVQSKDIDTGLITTETKFMDVGIKLVVTPTITDDGNVIMQIHPEVSSARRVAEVENALAVDTTQADTTLMIKDGDTVVLGGLIKDSVVKTVNKLPVLGDIPLLGVFFRNNTDQKVKQELIVFITPHLLNENGSNTIEKEAKRIEEITKRQLMLRQKIDDNSFEHEQE